MLLDMQLEYRFSGVEVVIVIILFLELTGVVFWPIDDCLGFVADLGGVSWIKFGSELFKLVQVVLCHRATGIGHGLLKVSPGNDWHWVIHFHCFILTAHQLLSLLLSCNRFSNGGLGSSLAQLCHISARKSLALLSQEFHVHIRGHWRFSKNGLDDTKSRNLIWKRDVNKLIQTTWSD